MPDVPPLPPAKPAPPVPGVPALAPAPPVPPVILTLPVAKEETILGNNQQNGNGNGIENNGNKRRLFITYEITFFNKKNWHPTGFNLPQNGAGFLGVKSPKTGHPFGGNLFRPAFGSVPLISIENSNLFGYGVSTYVTEVKKGVVSPVVLRIIVSDLQHTVPSPSVNTTTTTTTTTTVTVTTTTSMPTENIFISSLNIFILPTPDPPKVRTLNMLFFIFYFLFFIFYLLVFLINFLYFVIYFPIFF